MWATYHGLKKLVTHYGMTHSRSLIIEYQTWKAPESSANESVRFWCSGLSPITSIVQRLERWLSTFQLSTTRTPTCTGHYPCTFPITHFRHSYSAASYIGYYLFPRCNRRAYINSNTLCYSSGRMRTVALRTDLFYFNGLEFFQRQRFGFIRARLYPGLCYLAHRKINSPSGPTTRTRSQHCVAVNPPPPNPSLSRYPAIFDVQNTSLSLFLLYPAFP